jgi:L-alanine-DL-glutamate epimerase-like enolase superfamily enzyme
MMAVSNGGSRYRWVFLKIITSEPGLYGIGTANNSYGTTAVVTALQDHLKPWLIGKEPDRIKDLWQPAQMSTYWRDGPDIKDKRAGKPVYEMLGGKARDAVPVYDHQGARPTKSVWTPCKSRWPMAFRTCASNSAATAEAASPHRARAIVPKAATRALRLTTNIRQRAQAVRTTLGRIKDVEGS